MHAVWICGQDLPPDGYSFWGGWPQDGQHQMPLPAILDCASRAKAFHVTSGYRMCATVGDEIDGASTMAAILYGTAIQHGRQDV